jgi:hypothetical protein
MLYRSLYYYYYYCLTAVNREIKQGLAIYVINFEQLNPQTGCVACPQQSLY